MLRLTTLLALFTFVFGTSIIRADEPDMDKVRETLAQFEGNFNAVASVESDKIAGRRTAKWNNGKKQYLVSEEVYDSGPSG